jgi:hypothetical protein
MRRRTESKLPRTGLPARLGSRRRIGRFAAKYWRTVQHPEEQLNGPLELARVDGGLLRLMGDHFFALGERFDHLQHSHRELFVCELPNSSPTFPLVELDSLSVRLKNTQPEGLVTATNRFGFSPRRTKKRAAYPPVSSGISITFMSFSAQWNLFSLSPLPKWFIQPSTPPQG